MGSPNSSDWAVLLRYRVIGHNSLSSVLKRHVFHPVFLKSQRLFDKSLTPGYQQVYIARYQQTSPFGPGTGCACLTIMFFRNHLVVFQFSFPQKFFNHARCCDILLLVQLLMCCGAMTMSMPPCPLTHVGWGKPPNCDQVGQMSFASTK